ncbi:response regulator [Parvularcula sp. LCG005]|uniref:response regulator n=1 Tax=Parvularcula sp. LCG005 TaxID=3078805 RepID=UPI0029427DA8|nr:response regulator [Parvularcula sp. LCG005]WOI54098.1 response regulator [Parvularcula sp. LCG005]
MNVLRTIVCVEDDPDIRTIIELSLSHVGGYEVHIFEDGPTALLEIDKVSPDLIILDVMMPGMDGFETLSYLRRMSKTEETPVIFMTAKAQKREIQRYISAGAIDVIIKPFDPMTLSGEVQRIFDQWLLAPAVQTVG